MKRSPRYAEILKLAAHPEGVVMSSSNGGSVLQKLLKSGEVIKLPSGDKQVPSRYFTSQSAADAFKLQPPEVKAKKQKKVKPWNVIGPVKPSEKKPKKSEAPKIKNGADYSKARIIHCSSPACEKLKPEHLREGVTSTSRTSCRIVKVD